MSPLEIVLAVLLVILLIVSGLFRSERARVRTEKAASTERVRRIARAARITRDELRTAADRKVAEAEAAAEARIAAQEEDWKRVWADQEAATLDAEDRAEAAERTLAAARAMVLPIPWTTEALTALRENTCAHCGGTHAIACPRVKRLRFRPDGTTPVEVEFWADGEWPRDRIIWPEDLPTDA